TPWAPTWSPDGKFIAFGMSGSIWKVELATSIATELTYNKTYHSSPDWSPDGRWIIYTADDNARSVNLEILNVETGVSHALTTGPQIFQAPTFSPDGTRIAYASTEPNGYFNIYTRPIANGEWSGPPIAVTADNKYDRSRLYFGTWDFHIEP